MAEMLTREQVAELRNLSSAAPARAELHCHRWTVFGVRPSPGHSGIEIAKCTSRWMAERLAAAINALPALLDAADAFLAQPAVGGEAQEALVTIEHVQTELGALFDRERPVWESVGDVVAALRDAEATLAQRDAELARLRGEVAAMAGEEHADRCAQSRRLKVQLAAAEQRERAAYRWAADFLRGGVTGSADEIADDTRGWLLWVADRIAAGPAQDETETGER